MGAVARNEQLRRSVAKILRGENQPPIAALEQPPRQQDEPEQPYERRKPRQYSGGGANGNERTGFPIPFAGMYQWKPTDQNPLQGDQAAQAD